MNLRLTAVALAVLALAACTSTPVPTGTPTIAPTGTPPQTAPPTLTPLPTLPPTPTLIPTPSPTTPPTAPPTATPTVAPTATPTVAPTATPTATPTAAPTPQAWPAANRIARGGFSEPAVAIDAAGAVHIAVTGTGSDNQGIWYLTNATGSWVKQQIVTPWNSDPDTTASVNEPVIAIDPSDGSVWIAFVYWQCADCVPNWPNGIFIVNNAAGVWSAPEQLAGDGLIDPSVAIRDGHIYFVSAVAGDYTHRYGPVMFATNASGDWAGEQIARAGAMPHLTIDADGRAAVLFGGSAMRYARQRPNGSFAVERLPGPSSVVGSVWSSRLGVDPVTGDTWAAWTGDIDDQGHVGVFVADRGAAGWSDPITAIADAELIGLGVRDGVVQLTAAAESALIYASNGRGAFVEQIVDGSSTSGSFWGASALTLLPTGRPIVVFTRDEENGPSGPLGVWILKGPAV